MPFRPILVLIAAVGLTVSCGSDTRTDTLTRAPITVSSTIGTAQGTGASGLCAWPTASTLAAVFGSEQPTGTPTGDVTSSSCTWTAGDGSASLTVMQDTSSLYTALEHDPASKPLEGVGAPAISRALNGVVGVTADVQVDDQTIEVTIEGMKSDDARLGVIVKQIVEAGTP